LGTRQTPRARAAEARVGSAGQAEPDSEAVPLDGERKTVTVLFADIKGSMELIEDLDPEEARAIVDPALKLMIDAVHRYDGLVAQSMGDGIFALFGAPIAHEDHPQRALYAALRMQEESRRYANRLRAEGKSPISIRVGVNTGEVVVRSVRKDAEHSDYVPVGHSTGLAERMQALATPGSIAISEHTRKLVEGYFVFKALGPTKVKGVSEPINVYEVTGLGPLRTRLQRSMGRGPTKFVGRQTEMDSIARAAEPAKAGHGQIVAVAAEPGVGKSRLYYEFKVRNQSGWMVLEAFSVSFGKASAYLPVIDLLNSYFGIDIADDSRKRREKIAGRLSMLDPALDDARPYLFRLLGLVEGDDPLAQLDGQTRRRKTLDAIKRILIRESLNQPLMVIFEDLHWIDGETQALLDLLAESLVTAKILLLVNYRPEYRHEWGSKTSYTQLRLEPLARESAAEMLTALLGDTTEVQPLRRLIMETTGGNPFFMEETVQVLLDEGALVRAGTARLTKPLGELKIPPTVQAILASRIDRLPADEKQLLQTLAVIGRELQLRLIEGVLHPHPPEAATAPLARSFAGEGQGEGSDDLERMLADLQLREFILEQLTVDDIEYKFKHALTQQVAANSILIEKRKLLHERTAQAMESLYADRLDDHVVELAHHYGRSGDAPKAVDYLSRAARWALHRSAYKEADAHVSTAFPLLEQLPDNESRARRELDLQLIASETMSLLKGYGAPEVRESAARALELAQILGDSQAAFSANTSLLRYYAIGADASLARQAAEDLVAQADESGDPARRVIAHALCGYYLSTTGRLTIARKHFETSIAAYNSTSDHSSLRMRDNFCQALSTFASVLFAEGFPDQALAMARRGLELAREIGGVQTLTLGLGYRALVHQWRGDIDETLTVSEELASVTEENEFAHWGSWAVLLRGWATARKGQITHDAALVSKGLEMLRTPAVGDRLWWSMTNIAEVAWRAGDAKTGLAALEVVGDLNETADQRADLVFQARRWKGNLLTLSGAEVEMREAEELFRRCIAHAREGGGKLAELCATTSLARLFAKQGQRDEARAMLAEIYGWFTEGFDTAALKDAKILLDELNA
jgi:class 3 adenylate cyclase